MIEQSGGGEKKTKIYIWCIELFFAGQAEIQN